MTHRLDSIDIVGAGLRMLRDTPLHLLLLAITTLCLGLFGLLYFTLFFVAPYPRLPYASEKKFLAIGSDGSTSEPETLPCWYDKWLAAKRKSGPRRSPDIDIEPAELMISVVVPAYNEDERLPIMLEEAVDFLQREYGDEKLPSRENGGNGGRRRANGVESSTKKKGWEIIIVSDGSTDATVETALSFAKANDLSSNSFRAVRLEKNRGKGGAVTHGMRHVRGQYVIFADADGATRFSDLSAMVHCAQQLGRKDSSGKDRAVVVGSRAHLVGSEAVVKRSALRNLLMHGFHLLIRLLTPRATSLIGDTQCGFKLFTRTSLPDIIPYMHSEGWIFDVEMLMLTETAGIPMEEVPVGWKEVMGSKLNVLRDSLVMAWTLAVIRGAWSLGIWSRW